MADHYEIRWTECLGMSHAKITKKSKAIKRIANDPIERRRQQIPMSDGDRIDIYVPTYVLQKHLRPKGLAKGFTK